MVTFEFATATRIVFGAGTFAQAPAAVAALGSRPLLVTGKHVRYALDGIHFAVEHEPTIDVAQAGVELARKERCDVVVGLGGGSALDCAKAIAALATNGLALEHLEVIGLGKPLEHPPLPCVAIPTTAGTGSEVTRNAVLHSTEARVKASLRSPLMLPRLALVDPDLLAGTPRPVLASSGLDALSQLMEPFLSHRATPLTDGLAREGIVRSARSLRRAFERGLEAPVREDLAVASLCGGLCLANAGLGAVHGFAAPAGGMFAAPHGAVCAALFSATMDVNLRAVSARAPERLGRFRELAALLGTNDLGGWVRSLCDALEIPGLSHYGMAAADVPALVEKAKVASSMKGNPVVLTDDELTEIATRSL